MNHDLRVLGWMSGDWNAPMFGGEFYETWLDPTESSMVGVGHLIKEERDVFVEYLLIESTPEGVRQVIHLGKLGAEKARLATFAATLISETEALFRRDGDDFPTQIHYVKLSPDQIECTLTDNGDQVEVYDFRRRTP